MFKRDTVARLHVVVLKHFVERSQANHELPPYTRGKAALLAKQIFSKPQLQYSAKAPRQSHRKLKSFQLVTIADVTWFPGFRVLYDLQVRGIVAWGEMGVHNHEMHQSKPAQQDIQKQTHGQAGNRLAKAETVCQLSGRCNITA